MKIKNLTKKIKILILCALTFIISAVFGVVLGVKATVGTQTAQAATGSATHFYIKGASVRVINDENGHGIRFHVVMSQGMYNAYVDGDTGELQDTVTTSTLIIPSKLLGGNELTIDTPNVLQVETTDIWFQNADGDM
ncbi:MAG: hypothetical protein IJ373_03835, partial [Clostridia bacterium]|nr:hypothetical protein [Clostridia bacterium]